MLIVHRAWHTTLTTYLIPVECERDQVTLDREIVEQLRERLVQVVLWNRHLIQVGVLQVCGLADCADDGRGLPHPGENLLEDGDDMRVEVGLACQRIDDC